MSKCLRNGIRKNINKKSSHPQSKSESSVLQLPKPQIRRHPNKTNKKAQALLVIRVLHHHLPSRRRWLLLLPQMCVGGPVARAELIPFQTAANPSIDPPPCSHKGANPKRSAADSARHPYFPLLVVPVGPVQHPGHLRSAGPGNRICAGDEHDHFRFGLPREKCGRMCGAAPLFDGCLWVQRCLSGRIWPGLSMCRSCGEELERSMP